MVFLEAWLAGCPLVGRNLPEISADFVDAGMQYDGMYEELRVPLELVDEFAAREGLGHMSRATCQQYGRSPDSSGVIQHKLDEVFTSSLVDFARLTPPLQRELIARTSNDQDAADLIRESNPWLNESTWVDSSTNSDMIRANAEIVRTEFSPQAVGARLGQIYQAMMEGPFGGNVTPLNGANAILDRFLDIRRLHPIRL